MDSQAKIGQIVALLGLIGPREMEGDGRDLPVGELNKLSKSSNSQVTFKEESYHKLVMQAEESNGKHNSNNRIIAGPGEKLMKTETTQEEQNSDVGELQQLASILPTGLLEVLKAKRETLGQKAYRSSNKERNNAAVINFASQVDIDADEEADVNGGMGDLGSSSHRSTSSNRERHEDGGRGRKKRSPRIKEDDWDNVPNEDLGFSKAQISSAGKKSKRSLPKKSLRRVVSDGMVKDIPPLATQGLPRSLSDARVGSEMERRRARMIGSADPKQKVKKEDKNIEDRKEQRLSASRACRQKSRRGQCEAKDPKLPMSPSSPHAVRRRVEKSGGKHRQGRLYSQNEVLRLQLQQTIQKCNSPAAVAVAEEVEKESFHEEIDTGAVAHEKPQKLKTAVFLAPAKLAAGLAYGFAVNAASVASTAGGVAIKVTSTAGGAAINAASTAGSAAITVASTAGGAAINVASSAGGKAINVAATARSLVSAVPTSTITTAGAAV